MIDTVQTCSGAILVLGGGISGLTAAVEAAEMGCQVYLVEKEAYLGGRVARIGQYFPKLCSPLCGLEIILRRIRANQKVRVLNLAEVESIHGDEGAFRATVRLSPRKVNDNCTACGRCAEVCPEERDDDFNYGWGRTKAIYLPHPYAFPAKYTIDVRACQGIECSRCVTVCPYDAIELGMLGGQAELSVGAVIVATGWKPYDASRLDNLGFGRFPNVISNVVMERLLSPDGPTGGKLVRPLDGRKPTSVAFVQCAGSRDEGHLPYCSGVCCMASLKQAMLVKEKEPDTRVSIYYIDIRTPGTWEDFYRKVEGLDGVRFVRGKVASVQEDPETRDLTVIAEDTLLGQKVREKVDMAVLATGMAPNTIGAEILPGFTYDGYGFVAAGIPGIYAVGCSKRPTDVASSVRDAVGTALRAVRSARAVRAGG